MLELRKSASDLRIKASIFPACMAIVRSAMPKKPPSLLTLPFGELNAVRHLDAHALADQIEKTFPGLNAYDPLSERTHFFAKTISLAFPSVSVVASAMSASHVDRDGRQHLTLMLPLAGQCSVTLDNRTLEWGAGKAGVLIPDYEGRIIGSGDNRTLVMFRLDAEVLKQTACAMLGDPDAQIDLRLDEARTVPLHLHGRPVEPLLLQLGKLIDLLDCEVDALARQGYEDWFNRLVVGLIRPELFANATQPKVGDKSPKNKVINGLCDEMLANLGQKTTLTELEQKSGYSARALQYAFKARFGCSPLEWLREQRLQAARQRLLTGDYQTITQVAHECGFGSASQFSRAYKLRFGESPVQTLK